MIAAAGPDAALPNPARLLGSTGRGRVERGFTDSAGGLRLPPARPHRLVPGRPFRDAVYGGGWGPGGRELRTGGRGRPGEHLEERFHGDWPPPEG